MNLGTPSSASTADVREYLREFLSDPRVVDWPRWLWIPILHSMVLTFRPQFSAKLYASIWKNDSPLRQHMLALEVGLGQRLGIPVKAGMRYGKPSMSSALTELSECGCSQVRVIPLFPQFSMSQTLSISDELERLRLKFPSMGLDVVRSYGDCHIYLNALAGTIRDALSRTPQAHLLFSFHGLPARFTQQGDSYAEECRRTASLLAQQLGHGDWSLAFQSRFGPERWLEPNLLDTLAQLGHAGRSVVVSTPGFSCDCLETLEELDVQAKAFFKDCGGGSWERIGCLNATEEAIALLSELKESSFL